ncbi:2Fe-2S iron-sulfur cluster-binding protein [Candidatus Bipolaricaulota bacterium]
MEQQLADPLMDTVRITFHPKDTSVEVSRGVTVLEAAASAGVIIASICGGDGICGKCRVIIQSGEVDTEPTTLLTREEIQQGYALACTTRLVADTEVMVPPESRADGAQILIDEDARRFRAFFPTADKPTFRSCTSSSRPQHWRTTSRPKSACSARFAAESIPQ